MAYKDPIYPLHESLGARLRTHIIKCLDREILDHIAIPVFVFLLSLQYFKNMNWLG